MQNGLGKLATDLTAGWNASIIDLSAVNHLSSPQSSVLSSQSQRTATVK